VVKYPKKNGSAGRGASKSWQSCSFFNSPILTCHLSIVTCPLFWACRLGLLPYPLCSAPTIVAWAKGQAVGLLIPKVFIGRRQASYSAALISRPLKTLFPCIPHALCHTSAKNVKCIRLKLLLHYTIWQMLCGLHKWARR